MQSRTLAALQQTQTSILLHARLINLLMSRERRNMQHCQTDSCMISSKEWKSTSSQTTENFFQLVDLQELKKTTINALQDSFVGAFDRMNESVSELKTNNDEERQLKMKIKDLLRENERLRAENSQENKTKKPCQGCNDFSHRVDKLTKSLEKEKENTQAKIHEITIQKELQDAKVRADHSLLQHKLEIMKRQLSMQENEVASLEERIRKKNDLIATLEDRTGKMASKISELQDEVLSWKLHECQASNQQQHQRTELEQPNKGNDKLDTQTLSGNEVSLTDTCTRHYNDVIKDTTHILNDIRRTSETKEHQENKHQSRTDSPNRSETRKVQFIGTSNSKFVSLKYIAGTEFNISKKIKYTLAEIKDYIDTLESREHQDAFVLQSLCNDIPKKSVDDCVKELVEIIDTIGSKYKDAKTVVSIGLPRDNVSLNTKTEKINVLLKEILDGRHNVQICDNSNLFYRGAAQQGMLKEDGLHLSRYGTKALAKNIKESLYDVFDIPMVTFDSKGKERLYKDTYRGSEYDDRQQGTRFHYRRVNKYPTRDDETKFRYRTNGRVRDSHYEREDKPFYYHGHNLSPRGRRDNDEMGHRRHTYGPSFQHRYEDRHY